MTEQQEAAMRQALEALMFFEKAGLATLQSIDAGTALRQALEQKSGIKQVIELYDSPEHQPADHVNETPKNEHEQQPADEPGDERALVRKVDAELSANGLEPYTDVHTSRYRLLTAVRHFLSVSVGYLPDWLLQPAQAMREATEIDPRPQPAALEKKGSQND